VRYVQLARRYAVEVGKLQAAAPQDWMCEPSILAKTKLTVAQHQRRTVDNYLRLRDLAPDVPWFPVLQGWRLSDYFRHVDAYFAADVDLQTLPLVGLGTVCRRQHTEAITKLVSALSSYRLRLHGFGVKQQGLATIGHLLQSADSMAWSFTARRQQERMPGHTHKNCANCLPYALQWRGRMLNVVDQRDLLLSAG
jgi:hypothetical protein